MRLRNDEGKPVDPVPFLVTVLAGFLVLYSFGPGYLMVFGLPLATTLAVVTAVFGGVVAVAFHRFVWTARPERRGEVPSGVRFKRLVYAVLIGIGIIVLLLLPIHF